MEKHQQEWECLRLDPYKPLQLCGVLPRKQRHEQEWHGLLDSVTLVSESDFLPIQEMSYHE